MQRLTQINIQTQLFHNCYKKLVNFSLMTVEKKKQNIKTPSCWELVYLAGFFFSPANTAKYKLLGTQM